MEKIKKYKIFVMFFPYLSIYYEEKYVITKRGESYFGKKEKTYK